MRFAWRVRIRIGCRIKKLAFSPESKCSQVNGDLNMERWLARQGKFPKHEVLYSKFFGGEAPQCLIRSTLHILVLADDRDVE